MWSYNKKLQYPVKIKTPSPANAKVVMTQLGGPDGRGEERKRRPRDPGAPHTFSFWKKRKSIKKKNHFARLVRR